VQLGYSRSKIYDDFNWTYAIKTYHTFGRGLVEKGKGRKNCCYSMGLMLNLVDNYEFENVHNQAGAVYDDWMWELNRYGWAQHFRIKSAYPVGVTWIKGYFNNVDENNDNWVLSLFGGIGTRFVTQFP
jgi:hypothetical protein